MKLMFHLKGSADRYVHAWKSNDGNIYWTEIDGVPNSKRFHGDIEALSEYLLEIISDEFTKRNLMDAIGAIIKEPSGTSKQEETNGY